MMITDNIQDVAEIVRELDLEEVENILKSQVESQDIVSPFERDNFIPVYSEYKQIMDDPDVDISFKNKTTDRYFDICSIFVETIAKRFDLSYDADYYADHKNEFSGLAFSMYRFFILDLYEHTKGVVKEYIEEHLYDISLIYDELKSKKDAATLSNKKYVPGEYIGVASNIPDVIRWVFDQLTDEIFLDYCDKEDVVVEMISELYADGKLSGEFVDDLTDMYTNNVEFKSRLVFDITFSLDFGKSQAKTEED